jgi:hypothetical protein
LSLDESQTEEPYPNELRATLIQSGLAPEILTAAGVAAGEVVGVIGRANDQVVSSNLRLRDLQLAVAQAKVEVDRCPNGNTERLQAAQFAQDAAAAALGAWLQGVFDAATSGLSPQVVNALVTIRNNRAWNVPVEYKLVSRSESQWIELREALAAQRIALRENRPVPDAAQAVIAQADSQSATIAAKDRLVQNLAAIKNALAALFSN